MDCSGAVGWLQSAVHHLPPLLLEPLELPSCCPGSVHALALQQEFTKMLQKGALEPVDQPGLDFYSWLFLVEKATRGWRLVIELSALNGAVTLTKFQMETGICVGAYEEGGLAVLNRPQRSIPSGISAACSVLF